MAVAMQNGEENAQENLNTYMCNYCDSFSEILPMRTSFVQEISSIQDADEFTE